MSCWMSRPAGSDTRYMVERFDWSSIRVSESSWELVWRVICSTTNCYFWSLMSSEIIFVSWESFKANTSCAHRLSGRMCVYLLIHVSWILAAPSAAAFGTMSPDCKQNPGHTVSWLSRESRAGEQKEMPGLREGLRPRYVISEAMFSDLGRELIHSLSQDAGHSHRAGSELEQTCS